MNLTAEQRSRLVALLVASAALALSASETSELNFLQSIAEESGELDDIRAEALAAAHTQTEEDGADVDGDDDEEEDTDAETEDDDDDEEEESDAEESEEDEEEEEEDATAGDQARRKTGFLGNARSLLTSRSDLARQNSALRRQVADLKAQLSDTSEKLSASEKKIAVFKSKMGKLSADLAAVKKAQKTLTQAVTDELSQVGQPDAKLPATASGGKPQQPANEDELRTSLKDCQTEEERILLVRKYDKLRAAAAQN